VKVELSFSLTEPDQGTDVGWYQLQAISRLFEALTAMLDNHDLSEWEQATYVLGPKA
jgi:hypothetical protein